MCFAVSNAITKNQTAYNVTLAIDCLLVATMVSLVCTVVIGKVDLGLGQVGTLSNRAVQAMIGMSIVIFVSDCGTAALIKYFDQKKEEHPPLVGGVYVREMLAEFDAFPREENALSFTAVQYSTKNKCYIFHRSDRKILYAQGIQPLLELPEEGIRLSSGQVLQRHDPQDLRINLGAAIWEYRSIDRAYVKQKLKELNGIAEFVRYAPRLGIIVARVGSTYYYRTFEMKRFSTIPLSGVKLGQNIHIKSNGAIIGEKNHFLA